MRSCQKPPICWIEPKPAGSKKDLLLAKARPISDSSSASGIAYLRGQKACPNSSCTRAEIPLQPVGKALSLAVPLQPMEVQEDTENHLQPVEHPTLEQTDAKKRLGVHGKPVLQ